MDHARVTGLYRDGVSSIVDLTVGFSAEQWAHPTCGQWTAAQTARHLVAVVGWYNEWLDRALDGISRPPFGLSEFDERNAKGVDELSALSGAEAIREFSGGALGYLERAGQHWDLAYGYPAGTVTVGLHLGIAATEWNLHAWDLSGVGPRRHVPNSQMALFMAASSCVAATRPAWQQAVVKRVLPLAAQRSPWPTLLRHSGRRPT